jgi:hypothetical protein
MYPLLSQWTAEQTMDRGYDPDHLHRGPVYARPEPAVRSGTWSRVRISVAHLRATADTWLRRGSLGPVPDRCPGDPAGQAW